MHGITPGTGRGAQQRALAILPALAACLLAACAPRPVQELRAFTSAAETVRGSAQPLLDDLAVAERANRRRAIMLAARLGEDNRCAGRWIGGPVETEGFASRFCATDAPYLADIGDPPATAALRRGLDVVVRFATALRGLIGGEAAAEEAGQIQRLAQELGILAALAGGPTGGAAMKAAADQLKESVVLLLAERDARRARDVILAQEEAVERLIDALVGLGAEQASRIMGDREAVALLRQPAAQAAARVERMRAYRRLLANYVMMLEEARGLWRVVVAAARVPEGLRTAASADRLSEIRAGAEAFRRAYVTIRNPNP